MVEWNGKNIVHDVSDELFDFCVEQLSRVPYADKDKIVKRVNTDAGKAGYVTDLAEMMFSRPDHSGNVEMTSDAIAYMNYLSKNNKSALIDFVLGVNQYANIRHKY